MAAQRRRTSFAAPFVITLAGLGGCRTGEPATPTPPDERWSVYRAGDQCQSHAILGCPEGVRCNPPPPAKVACPEGLEDGEHGELRKPAGATTCEFREWAPSCAEGQPCPEPVVVAMPCPER